MNVFRIQPGTPNYILTRSVASVDEGNQFTITLSTQFVSVGTVVPYTITGISAGDLSSGSLTGNFVVGSVDAIVFTVAADSLTEGLETATLTLNGKGVSITVDVNDTSVAGDGYWINTIGGSGLDTAYGMTVDSAGNSYVVGYTTSEGVGDNHMWVAKFDIAGDVVWQRALGTSGNDFFAGVGVDPSGNVYTAGYSSSITAGQIIIVKYNSAGVLQWQRAIGGINVDDGRGLVVDSTGASYIVGYTNSSGAGNSDVCIAKFDTSGTVQWQRSIGTTSGDLGFAIALDSSDNVYVTGLVVAGAGGGGDVLIAKFSSSGTIQWQKAFGTAVSSERGLGLATDSSGNVFFTGYATSSTYGGDDVIVAKFSTTGALVWHKTIGVSLGDRGNAIAVDGAGNVYVTGYSTGVGAGGQELVIVKFDNDGALQYQRALGGTATDNARAIAIDSSGNMLITGHTNSHGGTTGEDILLAKLPSDGSRTGTYGPFTLQSAALSIGTSSKTVTNLALSVGTPTFTSSIPSFTETTSTLTVTKINVV